MDKICVRFMIDKERKRVVFAEAGSDFVDVLFSFLTLPLGSIVRLLGKQSGLGSVDSLYESVEQLDTKHLQTEACKEMLLNPRSAAADLCDELMIKNIHNPDAMRFYLCGKSDCIVQSTCYYTYATNGRCCLCGDLMDYGWIWYEEAPDKGGVFVNDTVDFMITDDLRVMPTSLMRGCSLLAELGIKDASNLEERVVDFSTEEVLNLLRRSLVSNSALTEVCFADTSVQAGVNCSLAIKEENDVNETGKEIILKLLINPKTNDVLYADAGEDFVNQLLSFLTFPLGSVLRLLADNIPLGGCISNLYSSVQSLSLDCFKSESCRDMLLTPKLATFYGFNGQILKLDEISSKKISVSVGCPKCYEDNGDTPCTTAPCKHGIMQAEIIEQNPKSAKGGVDSGVAFLGNSRRFMVANNLHISRLSFISAANGMHLPISDLVEKDVCVDNAKALSLLSAMLISKTVLTDVFCPKPTEKKPTSIKQSLKQSKRRRSQLL